MHDAGDPYRAECERTVEFLSRRLDLPEGLAQLTSSPSSDPPPGSGRPPSTRSASSAAPVAPALTVICPGFVSDCLETLEKINQLNRETFTTAGGGSFHYFHYIPWGNDSDGAIATLAQQARKVLAGWI